MTQSRSTASDAKYTGAPDLLYGGTTLKWAAKNKSFAATSGNISAGKSYQSAAHQATADLGPIPEGVYWLSLAFGGEAKRTKDNQLLRGDGIQTIANGRDSEWGANRVRLNAHSIESKVAAKNRDENSFYIHDSHKGYTHGCIEVQQHFFAELRAYAAQESKKGTGRRRLWLKVDYASSKSSTSGKTKY